MAGITAGVDEVGRGPLAGPVVAAAVVFGAPPGRLALKDSKALTERRRVELFEEICRRALAVGVGIVGPEEIDRSNILRASLLAMEEAIRDLSVLPDLILVDGEHRLNLPIRQKVWVHGDRESPLIAAASIVAKVTRDRIMEMYHSLFPLYGLKRNKGYGTAEHLEAIRRYGPTPIHRRTFRGVRECLAG